MSRDLPTRNEGDDELRKDLAAAIGARTDLGPRYEDQVIEVFLRRIEERVDARIEQAVKDIKLQQGTATRSHSPNFAGVVGPSLALAIPLVAIAGSSAGGLGIAAVMLCVFALNGFYFVFELLRP